MRDKIIAVFIFFILLKSLCHAEATLLLLPMSSRLKTSGVLAAEGISPSAMLINPAVLTGAVDSEGSAPDIFMEASFSQGFSGDDGYYYLGFSRGLRDFKNEYFYKTRIGFVLGYYDGGAMEFYDSRGYPRSVNAQRDYAGILGFSGLLKNRLDSIWFVVKFYSSELASRYTASALAFDAGIIHRDGNFFAAGSIKNLGTTLKYLYSEEQLPLVMLVMAGLAEENFTLGVLLPYNLRDSELSSLAEIGGEMRFNKILSARAGYKFNNKVENFTVGFGINFKNPAIIFDYSTGLNKIFENTHHITISYIPSF